MINQSLDHIYSEAVGYWHILNFLQSSIVDWLVVLLLACLKSQGPVRNVLIVMVCMATRVGPLHRKLQTS